MLGLNRTVPSERKAEFEFLRIEEASGSIRYIAMPNGKDATAFALKTLEPNRAVFENPSHDFPTTISYELVDPKTMRVEIAGTLGGKKTNRTWTWIKHAP